MESGPMTIRKWIVENGKKYKTTSEAADACAQTLHVSRKTFFNTISKLKQKGVIKEDSCRAEVRLGNIGLSEQELRSKHDVLYKLEQAVKSLIPGKFVAEAEFRATVVIDPSKFRSKADLPQFDAYKGRVGNIVYWGHPKDIRRLKDEGVLQ